MAQMADLIMNNILFKKLLNCSKTLLRFGPQ